MDQKEEQTQPPTAESKASKPISFVDRHVKSFEKQQKNIHITKIEQLKFKMQM